VRIITQPLKKDYGMLSKNMQPTLTTDMIKTAVIGLGAIGAGIAGNLHRAGMLSGAWNRTPARGQAAADAHGFELADSLTTAAQGADLVITSVSADQDLIDVAGQLIPVLPAGATVIDTSTVSSDTARQVADMLAEHNIDFLDGPVSGGKEGAEKGTMVMMVGGDAQVLEKVRPALDVITSKVMHMGPTGSGQATKAVNQIMVAGINQAVTEAMAFGQDAGLNMDNVVDLLSGGAAGNWFLQHRGKTMCNGTFEPGFRVALHHKDLKICQEVLAQRHIQLPMIEMTLVHYQRLLDMGYGDEDISALFRIKKPLFDK
jgi:3-hydroxyisobutyrate dehydrogenase